MHLQFVVGIQIYVLLHILMLDKHFKSCIPICLCVLVVVLTVLILHEMLPLSFFASETEWHFCHVFRELQAFIWDSPRLEYEAANDCDLTTAGDLFGRSGLGIGLRKNSHWTHPVSLAVLELHESE